MASTKDPYTGGYYNPRSPYGVNPNGTSNSQFAKETINAQHKTQHYLNSLNTGGNDPYGYSGYSTGYDVNALKAQWDSWLNEMNSYYKTLYNQQLKNTRTQFEKTRDPINLNFKRNEKAIRSMLGPDSGRGVGMLSGNNNDWANRIADARNWMGNQNAQSLADYHKNLADVKKVYAEKMASLM